ncbi:LamG domain-containing protein [Planosporangium thailandense]|uniref:LamG domain-containing protein n=1 Tax=Planosporangium thailandense TaxID=765197 RepID=A0ABX0Y4D7_9ACTN|nr:N,N-dimethylformamidase beta subunit family domain-containing protein [Planosporangium thailandense]NJC72278.1 LamG domain-containing protein [Planosporangium thailandense]
MRFPTWVLGYSDEFSVAPGERLAFHVSGHGADTVEAKLVRLIHGDTHPGGPGFREIEVDSDVDGVYPLVDQPAQHGSHARVPGAGAIMPAAGSSFGLFAFVQPTADLGVAPVISAWDAAIDAGVALVLEPGLRPALWLTAAGTTHRIEAERLRAGIWYALSAGWDAGSGRARVDATPVVNPYNSQVGRLVAAPSAHAAGAVPPWGPLPTVDLLLGAVDASDGRVVRGTFNGKISLPAVYDRALDEHDHERLAASASTPSVTEGLRAWWDLSEGIETTAVVGGGNAPPGRLVNLPVRAVTAHNWDGSSYNWRHTPELYGAVHFHADDVEDTGWAETCALTVPPDLRSGLYALRLRAGGYEDHVPFAVRAVPGRESDIALVLPSASYLAYANEHLATGSAVAQAVCGHTLTLQPLDLLLMEHPEFGRSTYDLHVDGSGVALTSRRRPILNMRPRHRFSYLGTWQLPADLYIVDWLEHMGYGYDVLTDEEVHKHGHDALRPYRVVLTGTHPEYASEPMLDAYEDYIGRGGRVMYLGANGFYWVVSFHAELPYVMEVRKGEAGSRAWQAAPGETLHSTTGEKGGLWRNRGRAPQKLVGTGFTAEGFNASSPYRRMPDSRDDRVSWIFDGVGADELIGDFGLVGGGAAGQELDRADLGLGTPPGTYLLASSERHDDSYLLVVEDIAFMYRGLGGTEHRDVRADLTYYESPGGGAVFSTSSIAWSGSLSHNDYDNNVSRVTANVLNRFLSS